MLDFLCLRYDIYFRGYCEENNIYLCNLCPNCLRNLSESIISNHNGSFFSIWQWKWQMQVGEVLFRWIEWNKSLVIIPYCNVLLALSIFHSNNNSESRRGLGGMEISLQGKSTSVPLLLPKAQKLDDILDDNQ